MVEDWKHYFDKSVFKIVPAFEGEIDDLLFSQVSSLHDLDRVDLSDFDIAILGIADARHSVLKGVSGFPDAVRPLLYGLRTLSKTLNILDLGNVLGKTVDDRYCAIEDVVSELVMHNIFPILIGGSQDYTIPMSGAIKQQNNAFRLSVVDAKIDWVHPEKDYSSDSFLGLLCSDEKRKPYDLSLVGVQKYLYSQYQEEQLKDNSYDILRLGQIRQKGMKAAEPWLRDADVISFDFTSIKQTDQPAHNGTMPNGFTGDEFCQMAWYAGLSDKLKCLGFFNMDVEKDIHTQGVGLGAQSIWHALEGFALRYNDFPVKELDSYRQYIVHLDDYEIDIKFFNNPINDRWWVEVPGEDDQKGIVACSRLDFEEASKNDIPERWFRFIKKNEL